MSTAPGKEISLEHSVPLNADAILPLLREQLEALEAESARDRLELSAGVPGSGTLSVPIALQVTYPAPHLGHFGIRITPGARYPLYPDFSGALDLVGTGLAEARLRPGTYHAPFSILGQLADQTLLHGVAEGSLADFLDRLAASVLAEVERRAMERYRDR
jgi:hypothetical protein